jgi:hypothetical protein
MQKIDIDTLNNYYSQADGSDSELFAEQKSNVLLVCGDHYAKKQSRYWNRIRESKDISESTRIRLTKNHIQKITKTYINNILTHAPGMMCGPKNKSELQDQKAAELHNSVWQDIKERHRFNRKIRELVSNFVDIGECAVKIFWDTNAGKFLGYEESFNENGEVTKTPKFEGDFVFERIHAFNLLRSPDAKSMDESAWLCYRKMIDIETLKKMLDGDQDKIKLVDAASDETYTVFDGTSGEYIKSKDQTMLREFYFRPCLQYPMGYYAIALSTGILWEGELPFGVFPISYAGFDEIPTSPRARSIIKQLRPYQAEINRAASKMAEHQITLGDDKILMQDGSKLSHGATLPGIRALKYTGLTPTVLEGRTGEQYLNYIISQVKEMYDISNVAEDTVDTSAQIDPYAMLFKSIKQKKRFSAYSDKIEEFLREIVQKTLILAKNYYTDDRIVFVVGRREQVNIAEFKNSQDIGYQIIIEAVSDDVETKMGKQITLNHLLQYVGNQLTKDDIGKLIRLMPYANDEQAVSDLTVDYDNATNDILALDRGEWRPPHAHDNHVYMLKRLTSRIKQADFVNLAPEIQEMYFALIDQHEKMEAENQRKLLAAKNEYIPTGGYMVTVDLYVADPKDPNKTRRARIPYDSVVWLIQQIEAQGGNLAQLEQLATSSQVGIAENLGAGSNQMPLPDTQTEPKTPISAIGNLDASQSGEVKNV